MSKLTVDLKVGETLTIGNATVRLEKKSGQQARLVVVADEGTKIKVPNSRRDPAHESAFEFQKPAQELRNDSLHR